MTRGKTIILLVALVGIVFIAILAGAAFYLLFRSPVQIKDDTVVEVVLGGTIHELPPSSPFMQFLEGGDLNLWELGQTLRYAARDDRVSAVYLEIHPLGFNWAQVEELREFLIEFKESGKPIHCFLAVDMAGESEMYLASAANSIALNPDAGLLINGLLAEITFYKRTMEKLGVNPQFIQFKEYKSPEVFTRESLTPEFRAMYESILNDIQNRFIATVAADRSVPEENLLQVVQMGIVPADVALREKLVDSLGYRSEVYDKLTTSGSESEDSEDDDSGDEYKGIASSKYRKAVTSKFETDSEHKIALVGASGVIIAGKSSSFDKMVGGTTVGSMLSELRKNEDIKGVILRVDSPGGSAVGSDMIWHEVELMEKANKPVIVSMSGVAASGGYYISMGARKIISQPSTITGSIGVIFGKFDLSGLFDWLGMDIDQVKLSPNADLFSSFSSLSDEQRSQLADWMEVIYQNFVQKAADGRGVDFALLEAKARGRVYTGAQAMEAGLIDELGGLRAAVKHMKAALDLEENDEIELILYPRPKSVWEAVASGDFFSTKKPESLIQWARAELQSLSTPSPWLLMPEVRIY
ncbi:MAG: signal peptide peptidase SppA [Acidobacteriota bacterium]